MFIWQGYAHSSGTKPISCSSEDPLFVPAEESSLVDQIPKPQLLNTIDVSYIESTNSSVMEITDLSEFAQPESTSLDVSRISVSTSFDEVFVTDTPVGCNIVSIADEEIPSLQNRAISNLIKSDMSTNILPIFTLTEDVVMNDIQVAPEKNNALESAISDSIGNYIEMLQPDQVLDVPDNNVSTKTMDPLAEAEGFVEERVLEKSEEKSNKKVASPKKKVDKFRIYNSVNRSKTRTPRRDGRCSLVDSLSYSHVEGIMEAGKVTEPTACSSRPQVTGIDVEQTPLKMNKFFFCFLCS